MPLTPEDVRNRRFKTSFRGYDEEEVDTFLDEVEVELTRLNGEHASLRERLEKAQSAPPPQPVASEAEEMLRRTLVLAQRTADETVAAAQAEAERLTTEARQQAAATIQAAEARAAESVSDLERRRQELERQIEGLRAFEREYRTRLKAYLESQLRDLDGRGGGAPEAPAPVAPVASPAPPVAPPPAVAAPAAPPVAEPAAGPSAVPPLAPDEPVSPITPVTPVPSVSHVDGEPEPFDIDDGDDGGIPRLAP